jgi:hypothetical protein
MNVSWKKFLGFAIALAIGFGVSLPRLQAQTESAAGKFKLPFDAKLGSLSLPTGDYKFSVHSGSLNGRLYIYRGPDAVGIVLPQSFSGVEDKGENPVLICIRHDGNTTVRALKLPNVGTFYFALPKDLQTLVAQQPQLIETVSIQVTGL